MTVLIVDDIRAIDPDIPEAKAQALIDGAIAQAMLVAPCLAQEDDLTQLQIAQFKSVLTAVVLRWNDQGAAAVVTVSETAGPYTHQQTVDNTQARRGLFWPSELDLLQQICAGSGQRRSGTHDTSPQPENDPLYRARINGPLGEGPGRR